MTRTPLRPAFLALIALLLAGCGGADLDFKQARHLDETGRFFRAIEEYENFFTKHPKDLRVIEAKYRAARLYADAMDRCEEAVPLYEEAARDPHAWNREWARLARYGLLDCPNYLPLEQGASWLYVDSLSGGNNMRLRVEVKASSAGVSGIVAGEMYAGEEMIQKYKRLYAKRGWAVYETVDGVEAPILKYPFKKERTWEARRGKTLETFRIVDDKAKVKVKAGTFRNCLKIRRMTKGYASWVYDYYCPGVGRVKTTVGVAGRENPNTELAEVRFPGSSPEASKD